MVTRYTRLLYKCIILFAFVLYGSTFDTKAQDATPRFLNCDSITNNFYSCDTISTDSTTIKYMGCDVTIYYILRVCNYGTMTVRHIEMQRFEIEETSPPCGLISHLYNSSPAPNGSINEVNLRNVIMALYENLSDSLNLPILRNIAQNNLQEFFSYDCDSLGLPKHGVANFQAYEGTCMAYCAIKYQVQQFSGPQQYKIRWSFGWNKCANTCCVTYIYYCWDFSAAPPAWRRTTLQGPTGVSGNGDDCNQYNPTESCQSPYIGDPRYQVLNIYAGTCKNTCSDLQKYELVY